MVTTFTQIGEAMREVLATYSTLKSSVSSATCMITTLRSEPEDGNAAKRAELSQRGRGGECL